LGKSSLKISCFLGINKIYVRSTRVRLVVRVKGGGVTGKEP
jgi:hypothetical protein